MHRVSRGGWLALLLLVPCAVLLVEQIATLSFPIVGEHRWRQADVYSVAYNFVHEDPDFFHPRIDWTNGKSGIMGMEPPILPYLIAGAMRVWGDDAAVGRCVAWALCMLGLLGFGAGLARERSAAFGALIWLCLLSSPMGLFELRQIQPDAAMSLLAAAAALLFVRASRSGRGRDYALALALYTLAVLLKGPAIVLAPAMLLFAISARPVRAWALVARGVGMLVPCLLLAGWLRWAGELNATYSSGRNYFALTPKPGELLHNLGDLPGLAHVVGELYPRYATNVWLVPATALGLIAAIAAIAALVRAGVARPARPAVDPGAAAERTQRWVHAGFLLWLVAVTGFLAAFSSRLHAHWYYADLALPALAYFTAHGLWLVLSVLLEPQPRARVLRYALVLAIAVAVPFAAREALARLGERSAANEARDYRTRVIAPLRAAVARYTTRADLITTNARDPSSLHDALRKGFTMSNQGIAKHRLAFFAKRHAVIYVHFGGPGQLPPEIRRNDSRYPLLLKRRSFRIYCLHTTCPELPAQLQRVPAGA
ncbi:MAG TPA: glycosyltransferase family 39 protein [Polyangiales bacterium]|nr:glycosyltransferase family 39 protein [Polyangiales bacterium]